MIYPSEDEWAEMDRLARKYEKIARALRYVAVFTAGALLLFLLTLFVANHSTPMAQDIFSQECEKALKNLKGN